MGTGGRGSTAGSINGLSTRTHGPLALAGHCEHVLVTGIYILLLENYSLRRENDHSTQGPNTDKGWILIDFSFPKSWKQCSECSLKSKISKNSF